MKKIKERCVFAVFWAAVISALYIFIIMRPFGSMDELWIFNMGLNVSRGLAPYSEVTMITPPLSHMLSAAFIKIFGEELLSVRLLALIISSADCLLIYSILRQAEINKSFSLIIAGACCVFFGSVFTYDYNFLILTLSLAAVLFKLKAVKSESSGFVVASSIFSAVTLLCKQSVGAAFWICMLICDVLVFRDHKKKMLLIDLSCAFVCGALLLIYLISAGNLADFVRYCITGIGEFDNRISVFRFMLGSADGFFVCVYSASALFFAAVRTVKAVKNGAVRENAGTVILLCSSAGLLSAAYPIADLSHSAIFFAHVILLSCILLRRKIKGMDMRGKNVGIVLMGLICVCGSAAVTLDIDLVKCSIKHYSGVPISRSVRTQIETVSGYIGESGKKTAILDAYAAVYLIPLDIYNKDLDMFLKGNVGGKASEVLSEHIDGYDTVLVLRDTSRHNWQFPKGTERIVLEKGEKQEEILNYDVYTIHHEREDAL